MQLHFKMQSFQCRQIPCCQAFLVWPSQKLSCKASWRAREDGTARNWLDNIQDKSKSTDPATHNRRHRIIHCTGGTLVPSECDIVQMVHSYQANVTSCVVLILTRYCRTSLLPTCRVRSDYSHDHISSPLEINGKFSDVKISNSILYKICITLNGYLSAPHLVVNELTSARSVAPVTPGGVGGILA